MIQTITKPVSREDIRQRYNLPKTKIATKGIDAFDPNWRERLRNDVWWESGNIQFPLSYLQQMIPHHLELDSKEFQEKVKVNSERHKKFLALHLLLLEIGGEETCFPGIEVDIDRILERGRYYPGHSMLMRGRPSQCHANVAALWENNHRDIDIHICTGYALSADGLWRQHSWLLRNYKTATQQRTLVIETTVKRLAYFGFELTEREATEFADNNY